MAVQERFPLAGDSSASQKAPSLAPSLEPTNDNVNRRIGRWLTEVKDERRLAAESEKRSNKQKDVNVI